MTLPFSIPGFPQSGSHYRGSPVSCGLFEIWLSGGGCFPGADWRFFATKSLAGKNDFGFVGGGRTRYRLADYLYGL